MLKTFSFPIMPHLYSFTIDFLLGYRLVLNMIKVLVKVRLTKRDLVKVVKINNVAFMVKP